MKLAQSLFQCSFSRVGSLQKTFSSTLSSGASTYSSSSKVLDAFKKDTLTPGRAVQSFLSSSEKALLCERSPGIANLLNVLETTKPLPRLHTVVKMLAEHDIQAEAFEGIAHSSPDGYQRNTILRTDSFELTALKWQDQQMTPIHNHKGSACAYKVLEGPVKETLYEDVTPEQHPVKIAAPVESREHETGVVCASKDNDIHALSNSSGHDVLTLHLYVPPITGNDSFESVHHTNKDARDQ